MPAVRSNQPVEKNIEKVVRLAEESSARRSLSTRVGTRLTNAFGTMASIIIHLLVIIGWCMINSGVIKQITPFDPYPFNLLTLVVSFEGVLIALFVLLTQNRMSREADLRAHLNLQVALLIEQELTATLTLVKGIAEKDGIGKEVDDVEPLLEATNIEHLADTLEKRLPQES